MKKQEYTATGPDLTNPAPFKKLRIPLPEKLETDAEFTQLFHRAISEFHHAINAYGMRYGYADRQRLLVYIMQALKEVMPKVNPEYIEMFPDYLDGIRSLVAQMIIMSMDYTGKHPEEDGIEKMYMKDDQ